MFEAMVILKGRNERKQGAGATLYWICGNEENRGNGTKPTVGNTSSTSTPPGAANGRGGLLLWSAK